MLLDEGQTFEQISPGETRSASRYRHASIINIIIIVTASVEDCVRRFLSDGQRPNDNDAVADTICTLTFGRS